MNSPFDCLTLHCFRGTSACSHTLPLNLITGLIICLFSLLTTVNTSFLYTSSKSHRILSSQLPTLSAVHVFFICQTEVEVSILKFLESCVVHEGEDVCFQCLLSHEDTPPVQWKLQDVPLQKNEMNLIKAEGRQHSLTLRGVTTADSGTVTFTVGNHNSTASLTVKGKGGSRDFNNVKIFLLHFLFIVFFVLETNIILIVPSFLFEHKEKQYLSCCYKIEVYIFVLWQS